MLRIIHSGYALPHSWPIDMSSEFQPGMIAQLFVSGNNLVCGVSDGTSPIGLIDDIRTKSFTAASIDEVIIVPVSSPVSSGGYLVTPMDLKMELQNPNVVPNSFISNPIDVELIPRNGVIVIPTGTRLNFDLAGTGTPDSIRTVVSYTYGIPNVVGDDSTAGSGRVTVWYQRMIVQTTMFETSIPYAVGSTLFCNESGLFTTHQITPDHAGVGIVTAPPSSLFGSLELLWL